MTIAGRCHRSPSRGDTAGAGSVSEMNPRIISAVDEWENTSIRALLPNDDLAAITEASVAAGLPSDVDRVGTVLLVMANTVEDEILTFFYVEGTLELGFVQYKGSDAIHALGAAPASTAPAPAQIPGQAQTSAS